MTKPVGDAVDKADKVLSDLAAHRPVSPEAFDDAFDALNKERIKLADRTDVHVLDETVSLNFRILRLGQEAVRSGLDLTPQQTEVVFGAGGSFPVGDSTLPTVGKWAQYSACGKENRFA